MRGPKSAFIRLGRGGACRVIDASPIDVHLDVSESGCAAPAGHPVAERDALPSQVCGERLETRQAET
jgi:hypothetical protein